MRRFGNLPGGAFFVKENQYFLSTRLIVRKVFVS
jgi:hypothetical protein